MNEYEIQKIINETKELQDIKNEYQKTQQLLKEKDWNGLQIHITDVMVKHPAEALIHNITNPCMPSTIEENAHNCMSFLENLFAAKIGLDIANISGYLSK